MCNGWWFPPASPVKARKQGQTSHFCLATSSNWHPYNFQIIFKPTFIFRDVPCSILWITGRNKKPYNIFLLLVLLQYLTTTTRGRASFSPMPVVGEGKRPKMGTTSPWLVSLQSPCSLLILCHSSQQLCNVVTTLRIYRYSIRSALLRSTDPPCSVPNNHASTAAIILSMYEPGTVFIPLHSLCDLILDIPITFIPILQVRKPKLA